MDFATGGLLLLIGILAGGYGTIVGAGGGFIFVPALLLIFKMDPVTAAASGLVIVLINALSGVFGYARQERIHYRTGILLAVGALPGSLLGIQLLRLYSSSYFYVIFATILVALGIFLLSKNMPSFKRGKVRARGGDEAAAALEADSGGGNEISDRWFIPLGLLMGVLSSYLGIGGGWLLVPILIYVFKVPTHYATATSIFSLSLYSLVGVISQIYYGNIDWTAVLFGGIGVIAGSQIGVFLSQKIPGKIIMQMLSALLICIGLRMYFE